MPRENQRSADAHVRQFIPMASRGRGRPRSERKITEAGRPSTPASVAPSQDQVALAALSAYSAPDIRETIDLLHLQAHR